MKTIRAKVTGTNVFFVFCTAFTVVIIAGCSKTSVTANHFALQDAESTTPQAPGEMESWKSFRMPDDEELKKKLSAVQYRVTREEGTETAFKNEYWDNQAAGLYVDLISGEPLFSSSDKFKSGTGWPSFVKPLSNDVVQLNDDSGWFGAVVEVRSKISDSHLGHVFDDGPADRGGKRYCMNSAALRFIPKDKMEAAGYAEYIPQVDTPAE